MTDISVHSMAESSPPKTTVVSHKDTRVTDSFDQLPCCIAIMYRQIQMMLSIKNVTDDLLAQAHQIQEYLKRHPQLSSVSCKDH